MRGESEGLAFANLPYRGGRLFDASTVDASQRFKLDARAHGQHLNLPFGFGSSMPKALRNER